MDSALRWHFLRCLGSDLETTPYTGRPTNWTFVVRAWRDNPAPRRVPKGLRLRQQNEWWSHPATLQAARQ